MLKALPTPAPFSYVPLSQRKLPADSQTSFLLKPLTLSERFDAIARAQARGGSAWTRAEELRASLQGWERFGSPAGDEVPMPRGVDGLVTTEALDWIGEDLFLELSRAASQAAAPTREEVGKS